MKVEFVSVPLKNDLFHFPDAIKGMHAFNAHTFENMFSAEGIIKGNTVATNNILLRNIFTSKDKRYTCQWEHI